MPTGRHPFRERSVTLIELSNAFFRQILRMTNSQRLAAVRDHLRRWLGEHACEKASECGVVDRPKPLGPQQAGSEQAENEQAENAEPASLGQIDVAASETAVAEDDSANRDRAPEISRESILIRDGFYAGRTFIASNGSDSFSATWFMEPDELKIRDPQGNVMAVFQGDEIVATPIAMDESADQETISIPMLPAAQTTPSQTDRHDQGDGQIHKAA
jgi:hypothetical protein